MNEPPPLPVPPSSDPAARVTPHPAHAFGGIWYLTRRRAFAPMHWLVLAGMLAVLVLFSMATSPDRETAAQRFIPWAVGFYLTFLLPILAFLTAGGVMRDEMKGGTVDYVLTRPLPRPVFLLCKFVAHLICAQVDFLCALAVIVGVGVYWQVPNLWAALPHLLAMQVLLLAAYSAFGFLSAVLTSRYVVVGLVYGGIVEIGLGRIPTQLNRLSMIRQVHAVFEPLVRTAETAETTTASAVEPASLPMTAAIIVTFTVASLAIAAAVFAWRELASGQTREA